VEKPNACRLETVPQAFETFETKESAPENGAVGLGARGSRLTILVGRHFRARIRCFQFLAAPFPRDARGADVRRRAGSR